MYLAFLHQLIKKLLTDYQKIRTFSISAPVNPICLGIFFQQYKIIQSIQVKSLLIMLVFFVSLDIPQKRN